MTDANPVPSPLTWRTWAEIDLDALCKNWRALLRLYGENEKKTFFAVLKANAYGHGDRACAEVLLQEGCTAFAVATPEEAIGIRKTADKVGKDPEILILGDTPTHLLPTVAEHRLTLSLLSPTHAARIADAARVYGVTLKVHFAIDTGMNRVGFLARRTEEIETSVTQIVRFCALPCFLPTGVYSHLQNAADPTAATAQAVLFDTLRKAIRSRIKVPLCFHLCNTAGAYTLPEHHMNGIRLGIHLYGVEEGKPLPINLLPVMRLKSRVIHLHSLCRGDAVGYGGEFVAFGTREIATLPIGYADGLLRACTSAEVLIQTHTGCKKAHLVGRICMDSCMLDVTDLGVSLSDTVTLFGNTPEQILHLAHHAGTIPYELLCAVSPRVPKLLFGGALSK